MVVVCALTVSGSDTSRLERVHAPGERLDGVQDGLEADSSSSILCASLGVPDGSIRQFF